MTTIYETLVAAKNLISNPDNWTQEAVARDSHGADTYSLNTDAVCWCSIGALHKVTKNNSLVITSAAKHLRFVLEQEHKDYDGIAHFNDSHTHAEVMAFWNKAIAAAKEKGV